MVRPIIGVSSHWFDPEGNLEDLLKVVTAAFRWPVDSCCLAGPPHCGEDASVPY